MKYLLLLSILLVPVQTFAQHGHSSNEVKPAPFIAGMGDVRHPVSTSNAEAQNFFNQGLAFLYGFNHEGAVRSFRRAAELDSQLGMAHWGIALALGSNYNLQADAPQLKEAYASVQKALALSAKSSEHERAYFEALSKRYSSDPQADVQKLALDYKNAMGELVKRYPDDLDAATLYAESMMNLRPWKLWMADGKPAEGTDEIIATLEGVLKRDPHHIGANHYYIHAVEASSNPERGLPSASRLERLAPAAGHLVHMPSHIYIRTGDYEQAAKSNSDAIAADRAYFQRVGTNGVYPMMYFNHNIHFLASSQAMNGRYADAIKTARELEANVKPHLKAMPMLEMFMPYTTVTLVRFRRWDEILNSPEPDRDLKITGAFWHFARGMAYVGTKRTAQAENELQTFRRVVLTVPENASFGNSTARGVLQVADYLLAGKIALARGDKKAGFELLRKGVEVEDVVSYNEPPDWDLPVREFLGAALLSSGEYAEGEKVFRAELAKHPRNGRALFGLVESLNRQGKSSSAQMVQREFERAWGNADTKLRVEDLYAAGEDKSTRADQARPTLRFDNVQLKTGARLRYAEQGDHDGPPIIMLHGYTDSWYSFSRVLPLLSTRYHVYAIDLRGHGDSDRPASRYTFAELAADVVAFMDAKGLARAHVVGHSMGSFIAQQIAATSPQRVQKLVLIGTATGVRNDDVLDLQKAVNELKDPIPSQFVRDFQSGTAFQPLPEEFMNRVVTESLKLPAQQWRAVMAGMLASEPIKSGEIKSPTLILWGEHETVFRRAEQESLLAKISGAALKVYPNTGHALHWEEPEQFVRDLEKFISGNN
jgi:pimeloyl-ACP methyl ester carboxylesterase/tetratricopeptide (TPR) repeat protein